MASNKTNKTTHNCETCESRGKGVFCDLPADMLGQLSGKKTSNLYKAHQVIFYEGNQPFGLYCIKSGKVKVYKTDTEGHQQIVRLVGAGDLLGYRCLISNEIYSATAETLSDTEICFIDKQTFMDLIEQHPKTALNLLRSMAQDLRSAEDQHINLVHKNTSERLAELFLLFHKRYGKKEGKKIVLDIQLTREEIAEMIGTTQESVIRLMSKFKQDGLIEVEGRKISLLDLPELLIAANLAAD